MNQRKIIALLKEASQHNCCKERRLKILLQMQVSKAKSESRSYWFKREGFDELLERLYHDVLEKNPKSLPGFFPVFALVFGNRRHEEILSQIDPMIWVNVE